MHRNRTTPVMRSPIYLTCRLIAVLAVSRVLRVYLFYHLDDRHHRIRTCFSTSFSFLLCRIQFVRSGIGHISGDSLCGRVLARQSAWKYESIRHTNAARRNPIEFNHKFYEYFSLFIDLCLCVRFVFRDSHLGIMADCIAELWAWDPNACCVTFARYASSDADMFSRFSCTIILCVELSERWASSQWMICELRTWMANQKTKNTANEFRAIGICHTFIGRAPNDDEHETMYKNVPIFRSFIFFYLFTSSRLVYSFILLLRPK